MIDKFEHQTLESGQFQVESTEKPKIKSGGSSSSNLHNRYFDALSQDIALVVARSNILGWRADRLALGMNSQAAALLSVVQSISSRVDAASGYSQVLADVYTTYINTGSTTADLSYFFGQATLPVRSTTDLLVHNNVYGNPSVYSDVEISYALKNTTPNNDDYIVDTDALEMLKGYQPWVMDPTSTTVWIKLKAPLQYQGLTPNVLEIHPFPAYGHSIQEVAYQIAGNGFTSTWTTLDLSYLPLYDAGSGVVPYSGPVRLHLPNIPTLQIRIKLQPLSGSVAWGLHLLKLYHREYETSGTLVFKDPYSRTIGNSLLRGKDPGSLSLLQKTVNSNQVSVTLTTTNTSETPVITGSIFDVS